MEDREMGKDSIFQELHDPISIHLYYLELVVGVESGSNYQLLGSRRLRIMSVQL